MEELKVLDVNETEIKTIVEGILSKHGCGYHVNAVNIDDAGSHGKISMDIVDDMGCCDAIPLSALNAIAEEFGFEDTIVEAFVSEDDDEDEYDSYLCLFGRPTKHIMKTAQGV